MHLINVYKEQLERLSDYLNHNSFNDFLTELIDCDKFLEELEIAVKNEPEFLTKKWASPLYLGIYRVILYVLCRHLKPKVFIETGVLHGLTSYYILSALKRNGEGKLISVDLPSYSEFGPSNKDGFLDTLPKGKEPGWVIPKSLSKYWELNFGSSNERLPEIFTENKSIDIFLHDSEHTYKTMNEEFELSWPKIRKGGFLIADNIDENTAFFDFCLKIKKIPLIFTEIDINSGNKKRIRFGLIKK